MKFAIDLQLIQDRKIEDLDKLVYAIMDSLSQSGKFSMPFATLTKLMNYNKNSINHALGRLAVNGYIDYQIKDEQLQALIISERDKFKQAQFNQNQLKQQQLQKENEQKQINNEQMQVVENVLAYLNQKTKKNLKATTKSYQDLIKSLLKKGYTQDNIFQVIDTQYKAWQGTSYIKYLRPSTLFRPSKFDEYLNSADPATIRQHKYDVNGKGKNALTGF